jgi:hypothetical protein
VTNNSSSPAGVVLLVDGKRIDLAAGDYAYAPRGTAHAYVAVSAQARMLLTVTNIAGQAVGWCLADLQSHFRPASGRIWTVFDTPTSVTESVTQAVGCRFQFASDVLVESSGVRDSARRRCLCVSPRL